MSHGERSATNQNKRRKELDGLRCKKAVSCATSKFVKKLTHHVERRRKSKEINDALKAREQ